MPGLNDAEVKVVDVSRHSYTGGIREATRQAIDAAKLKYVPNGEAMTLHYNNFGKKFDYSISGNAIEESLNPKHQAKSANKGLHLALAEHIDEIINESIEVEEHPDYTKDESGFRGIQKINGGALMHRFYGASVIDGKPYRVMTLMREDSRTSRSNGVHAYEVQKIEVLDKMPNTSNGTDGLNSELEASSAVSKLLQNVEKSYDKGKKLLDESRKVDKRADESVLDYAKRMSEESVQPLPAANAKQRNHNNPINRCKAITLLHLPTVAHNRASI